tara:strand:+ start:2148 stop:2330 length:183 start_codon:yes stop_codon:yes gene_type:complete
MKSNKIDTFKKVMTRKHMKKMEGKATFDKYNKLSFDDRNLYRRNKNDASRKTEFTNLVKF